METYHRTSKAGRFNAVTNRGIYKEPPRTSKYFCQSWSQRSKPQIPYPQETIVSKAATHSLSFLPINSLGVTQKRQIAHLKSTGIPPNRLVLIALFTLLLLPAMDSVAGEELFTKSCIDVSESYRGSNEYLFKSNSDLVSYECAPILSTSESMLSRFEQFIRNIIHTFKKPELPEPLKEALKILDQKTDWGTQQWDGASWVTVIDNSPYYTDSRMVKKIKTDVAHTAQTITHRYALFYPFHSGRIDLIYDLESSQLKMEGTILGPTTVDGFSRWAEIADWVELFHRAEIFTAAKPLKHNSGELFFAWNIPAGKFLQAINEFKAMLIHAQYFHTYSLAIDACFERWKDDPQIRLLAKASVESSSLAFLPFHQLGWEGEHNAYLKALSKAKDSLRNGDEPNRKYAYSFFHKLINEGIIHPDLIIALREALPFNENVIDLFALLIENDLGFKEGLSPHPIPFLDKAMVTASWKEDFRKSGYEEMVSIARQAIIHEDRTVVHRGRHLFWHLLNKGLGIDEAISSASTACLSRNEKIIALGLDLFGQVITHGQYDAAFVAAKNACNHFSLDIAQRGLSLLEDLLDKQYYDPTMKFALEEALQSHSDDPTTLTFLFDIFAKLPLEQKEGYSKTIVQAVHAAVKNENECVARKALNFLAAVSRDKIELHELLSIGQEACMNPVYEIANQGLKLLQKLLVEKNTFEESIFFAKHLVSNSNHYMRNRGLDLFVVIVNEGYGFQEALDAVIDLTQDGIDYHSKELLLKLVQQGFGHNEALALAQKFCKQTANQGIGRLIFQELFHKEKGYEEAFALIEEGLQKNLASRHWQDLLKRLSEKGEFLIESIDFFKKILKASEDGLVNRFYFELWVLQVEKIAEKGQDEKILQVALGAILSKKWFITFNGFRLLEAILKKEKIYNKIISLALDEFKAHGDPAVQAQVTKLLGLIEEL